MPCVSHHGFASAHSCIVRLTIAIRSSGHAGSGCSGLFSMENVKGLVMGVAKGYFRRLMVDLRGHGYTVGARILDAQWLGVPQSRQRVFVVGVRTDLGLEPVFPDPLPYRYSMADALPHLRRMRRGGHGFPGDERGAQDGPSPTVCATGMGGSYGDDHDVEATMVTQQYGPGSEPRHHGVDSPAPTVMARGIGGVREYQATIEAADTETAGLWVRMDQSYTGRMRDTGAEPAPTIIAEEGMQRLEVVETTYEFDTKGQNQAPHSRSDPEQHPAHAITVSNGAAAYHHTIVETTSPADGARELNYSESHGAAREADPDEPSPCVLAEHVGFSAIVPTTERRKLTIPEVRALCGFPDDFTVEGDYAEQWARFGNSVPPPMARAVGAALAPLLLGG